MRLFVFGLCLWFTTTAVQAQPDQMQVRAGVGATIVKIHVKADALVKKGELLFEFDDRLYRSKVAEAEANVLAAEAQSKLGDATFARADRLLKGGAIGPEEHAKAAVDRQVSQAGLAVAKARLDQAKLQLEGLKVYAPSAGKIGRVAVRAGELVKANDVLATIVGDEKGPSKIRKLQEERRDVLVRLAEITTARVKEGAMPPMAALQAQRAALDANLEVAENAQKRIELLGKNVQIAEEMHKIADALFKAGNIPETGVLQARAALLDARIRLAREEAKSK